ncbi:MAG: sulfotransferase [Rhodospirillales bacterium]
MFLAGLDEESEAARAAADRVGDDAGKWPRATGERSPTKIEKAERKLHEILRRVPAGKEPTHLRNRLFRDPTDVAAMRLLALHEWRDDDQITAQSLLERALDLSPGYTRARSDLASLLNERRNFVRALAEADRLLASTPRDQEYRAIRADALVQIGRFAEAIEIFEGMLKVHPRNAKYWVAYGNSLHYIGRRDDSVAAYRNCLALAPTTGEAYWGLADLKGKFVTEADVAAMRVHLAGKDLDLASRWHMSYALGHALERAGDFAGSFAAYQDGAQAFREHVASTSKAHSPDTATDRVRRLRKVFSAEHIAARATPAASPAPRDTPIFVVGMPRAGSTLVEQILASHSMVEGTRELPLMGDITRELTMSRCLVIPAAYPERVLELKPHELAALGERYIRNSSVYRHTDRPFFVDKRPWNWQDAGLIRLIMPHAKIIDVRREPMAACFAMFKQLLPVDASFSYDLTEVGRYYNEYVDMMQHWETALPGHIHYLSYERLVEDTETEIRRMLEYCGLPFEEGCLRFWETDRAVLTPSAEQVRRPIFRDALQQWRNYEPWLDPLKAALATPVEAWFK